MIRHHFIRTAAALTLLGSSVAAEAENSLFLWFHDWIGRGRAGCELRTVAVPRNDFAIEYNRHFIARRLHLQPQHLPVRSLRAIQRNVHYGFWH